MKLNKPAQLFMRGYYARNEHDYELARNRLVIVFIFLCIQFLNPDEADKNLLVSPVQFYSIFCISSFFLFISSCLSPASSTLRLILGLIVNISSMLYLGVLFGPDVTGYLYTGFLLTIYGYGFRYNGHWLAISTGLVITALLIMFTVSPLWAGHTSMKCGILMSFVLLPFFVGKLVLKVLHEKARAEETNRTKSLFVAGVSHDLRSPLNAIIGLGDLLATSRLSTEEADMARMIGASGRSLLTLIDSVLELTELEMGRAPVVPNRIDLYAMLFQLRELLDVSASAKGLRLSLSVTSPCPRFIMASERHIKDSLINLLGNAVKFTTTGSVTIRVCCVPSTTDRTRLRFEVIDTGIGISPHAQERIFDSFTQASSHIRENFGGSGLGLAIVRQLVTAVNGRVGVISQKGQGSSFWFEMEVEDAPARERQICPPASVMVYSRSEMFRKQISDALPQAACVESISDLATSWSRHRGRHPTIIIDGASCYSYVNAQLGKLLAAPGTRRAGIIFFGDTWPVPLSDHTLYSPELAACSILIPTHASTTALSRDALIDALILTAGPDVAGQPDTVPHQYPARRILVAEDNRTNQIVLEKMLVRAGHYVELVNDGKAALDRIARTDFDLILMDINMPGLDGIEATRFLRMREAGGKRVPVIALTADVTPATRTLCLDAGMNTYFNKPIDLPALLAAIDLWTKNTPVIQPSAPQLPQTKLTLPETDRSATVNVAVANLNLFIINDLESLGGRDFVQEIALQFIADATCIMQSITSAVRDNDIDRFLDEAHALRSCSANIGAQAIFEACLSWRCMNRQELASEGSAHLARLEQEFVLVRAALESYTRQAA